MKKIDKVIGIVSICLVAIIFIVFIVAGIDSINTIHRQEEEIKALEDERAYILDQIKELQDENLELENLEYFKQEAFEKLAEYTGADMDEFLDWLIQNYPSWLVNNLEYLKGD